MAKLTLTRTQAADVTGLSSRHFDGVIRDRIPADGRVGAGSKLRYVASAVVAAFVAYRIEQERPPVKPSDDGDPLMVGADAESPALEQYRAARAGQEKIKLAEMQGRMVSVAELEPAFGRFTSTVRQTGDTLQRQFGPEASRILNEGLDEAAAAVERYLSDVHSKSDHGRPEAGGRPVQDGAAADDAAVRGGGDPPAERSA